LFTRSLPDYGKIMAKLFTRFAPITTVTCGEVAKLIKRKEDFSKKAIISYQGQPL